MPATEGVAGWGIRSPDEVAEWDEGAVSGELLGRE